MDAIIAAVDCADILGSVQEVFAAYVPDLDALVPAGDWQNPTVQVPLEIAGVTHQVEMPLFPAEGDIGYGAINPLRLLSRGMWALYFSWRFVRALWTTVRQW